MNLTTFTISLALVSMISCTPSSKEASEESGEPTTAMPEEVSADSGVYFVDLKDGDTVTSPVVVNMGVNGMDIEPAGTVNEGKGHHHIIVDGGFMAEGEVIPADATHFHYGKGQTSDTLSLSPGSHTITLQFANGVHASYGEAWSKTIAVAVEGSDM